jgi:hypothetical protein
MNSGATERASDDGGGNSLCALVEKDGQCGELRSARRNWRTVDEVGLAVTVEVASDCCRGRANGEGVRDGEERRLTLGDGCDWKQRDRENGPETVCVAGELEPRVRRHLKSFKWFAGLADAKG